MITVIDKLKQKETHLLLQFLDKLDLRTKLEGEGPFTIFAPTDRALNASKDPSLKELQEDPKELERTIKYHIVPEKIMMVSTNYEEAKTLDGYEVKIRTKNGPKVNDNAIKEYDIEADNGVVHVIDYVLHPDRIPEPLRTTPLY